MTDTGKETNTDNTGYLSGLDMKSPQGVAWYIVTTMIEHPDGQVVRGHGWYESCAIRIADKIRALSDARKPLEAEIERLRSELEAATIAERERCADQLHQMGFDEFSDRDAATLFAAAMAIRKGEKDDED